MARVINISECVGCGACQRVCLVGCIQQADDKKRQILESVCVDCGACQFICPKKCITQK